MDLNILWFILITVLFTGFFILEGFDYGVGMLLAGRDEKTRNQFVKSIGPVWDANEVWMITAGGAAFAAFPHFYATMFSTFYLALFLMLFALIMRGVAFELRGKFQNSDWKKFWDGAIIFGSFIPALLWGIAITNLVQGLPINSKMVYLGGFFDLLSPYTILGGLLFVTLFLFHGLNFLTMKLADEKLLYELTRKSKCVGFFALAIYLIFIVTNILTQMFGPDLSAKSIICIVIFSSAQGILYSAWQFARDGKFKAAFFGTTIVTAMTTVGFFAGLFPNLMISNLTAEWNLTIYNAASTSHTLTIMTVAAVILVPIILCYQAWTYKIFKDRVSAE